MLTNCRENGRIVDGEQFACEFRAEWRMQYDRMAPFEGADRQAAPLALVREPFCGIEAREIV